MAAIDGSVKRGMLIKSHILGVLGAVIIAYHLWFAYTYGLTYDLHLVLHVMTMLIAAVLLSFDPMSIKSDTHLTILDNFIILPIELLLSILASLYLVVNYERLAITSFAIYNTTDEIIGFILILLVLDLTRRTLGWVLAGVGIAGFVYGLGGPYLPGILNHSGYNPTQLITGVTVEFTGLYDTLVAVSATYIILFLFLAGFLEAFGALDYFIDIAKRVSSHFRSGITQIAVITSLGMASLNGSATANAATTGAFTIPTIQKRGLKSETAAAIESVASTGGQIMPPVMGAAAFLIAEFTGTPYVDVIIYSLLPALIFYITVSGAVFVITSRTDMIDEDMIDDTMETESTGRPDFGAPLTSYATYDKQNSWIKGLIDGFYLWFPVFILIYTLVILRYSAQLSALYSIIAAILSMIIQSVLLGGLNKEIASKILYNVSDGCYRGLEQAAPIALATASMAFFVQVLSMTGFTLVFADSIVTLAGGQLILLLIFSMIGAILFGLGMPTTAAYIVAVLLVAPALTQAGIPEITSHLYVFYFAILSAITPPVAIVCIVTSQIADADFLKTCYESIIIAIPLFILPYVFVINPGLIVWDSTTLFTFLFVCIGNLLMVISLNDSKQHIGVRLGLFAVAVLILIAPIIPINIVSPMEVRALIILPVLLIVVRNYRGIQKVREYI